jgi:hypothetical protein
MTDNPNITIFQDAAQIPRLRCDAPGERAVSAEITDPMTLIRDIAFQCGLEVDDATLPDSIVISVPAGS